MDERKINNLVKKVLIKENMIKSVKEEDGLPSSENDRPVDSLKLHDSDGDELMIEKINGLFMLFHHLGKQFLIKRDEVEELYKWMKREFVKKEPEFQDLDNEIVSQDNMMEKKNMIKEEGLKTSNKNAIKAFINKQSAVGSILHTDGENLYGDAFGLENILASWNMNNEIEWVSGESHTRIQQSIQRFIQKNANPIDLDKASFGIKEKHEIEKLSQMEVSENDIKKTIREEIKNILQRVNK